MSVGRGFRSDEEHLPVVILGHALWQQRFAADPLITGKAIHPFRQTLQPVVGVAPPGFHGVDQLLDCQFWVPLGNLDALLPNTTNYQSRDYHWIAVIGRMRPDAKTSHVTAELDVLAHRILKAHPDSAYDDAFRFEQAGSFPPRDKSAVLMFLAALSLVALMVLCIAGANVGNLFLAQAAARQREFAVRLALGATRRHLLRQMLTESIMLSLAGGLVGVALSLWATRGLGAFHPPAPVPLDLNVSVDARVVVYSFLLSLATGVLFGLAPAWTVVRPIIASRNQG